MLPQAITNVSKKTAKKMPKDFFPLLITIYHCEIFASGFCQPSRKGELGNNEDTDGKNPTDTSRRFCFPPPPLPFAIQMTWEGDQQAGLVVMQVELRQQQEQQLRQR